MTPDEYRRQQAEAMSEAQLLTAILGTPRRPGLAPRLGWELGYHTHRSDRSPAGFPDLVLVHPAAGLLRFAELKRQNRSAKPTAAQVEWLEALADVADRVADLDPTGVPVPLVVDVYLWRPLDLLDGTIEAALRVSK